MKTKGVIIEQHTKVLYLKIHPQGGLFVGRDNFGDHTETLVSIRKNVRKIINVAVTFDTFASIGQMVFWVPNRTQERMVDALAVRGDEGRGVAAKSSGEACSNL